MRLLGQTSRESRPAHQGRLGRGEPKPSRPTPVDAEAAARRRNRLPSRYAARKTGGIQIGLGCASPADYAVRALAAARFPPTRPDMAEAPRGVILEIAAPLSPVPLLTPLAPSRHRPFPPRTAATPATAAAPVRPAVAASRPRVGVLACCLPLYRLLGVRGRRRLFGEPLPRFGALAQPLVLVFPFPPARP